jgi:hypothetical protein
MIQAELEKLGFIVSLATVSRYLLRPKHQRNSDVSMLQARTVDRRW